MFEISFMKRNVLNLNFFQINHLVATMVREIEELTSENSKLEKDLEEKEKEIQDLREQISKND